MEHHGFEVIEHTADWAIEVWAPDPERLLRAAAEGMFSLLDLMPASGQINDKTIECSADDMETLMVTWLEELLFIHEMHGTIIEVAKLEIQAPHRLKATLHLIPANRPSSQIKAVTFHQLDITRSKGTLKTQIIFDV